MLRHLPPSPRTVISRTTNIDTEYLFNALRDCLYQLHASFLFISEIIHLSYQTRLPVSCAQRAARKRKERPKISLENDLGRCVIELKICLTYLREARHFIGWIATHSSFLRFAQVLITFNLLRLTATAKHRMTFHLSERTVQRNQYIPLVENIRLLTEQANRIPSDLFQYLVIR